MFGKRVFQMIGLLTIVSAMIACAPNPYSDVTTLLGSKGPAAKERAASRLAGMKGDIYVDALVKALYDPSQRVIIAAADALGETGDPRAIPHLEKLLSHGNSDVADAAARALSRMKSVEAAEALLSSENAKHRAMGIDMLGKLQLSGGVPALAFALGDKEPSNRLQAVRYLRQVGTEEAAKALKMAAEDPDEQVRSEAVDSLISMGGDTAFVSLSASSHNLSLIHI